MSDSIGDKAKELAESLEELAKKEGLELLEKAKAVGKDAFNKLTGDGLELVKGALTDLARLKIKQAAGQHVGREVAIVESTLYDLKTVVSIEAMRAIRDVVMASAGHATNIFAGLFGRVMKVFGA